MWDATGVACGNMRCHAQQVPNKNVYTTFTKTHECEHSRPQTGHNSTACKQHSGRINGEGVSTAESGKQG